MFAFTLCVLFIVLLGAYPTEFYFGHRRLEEWMIYRFVVCHLLGSFGLMLLLASALVNRMAQFGPRRSAATAFWPSIITALLRGRFLGAILTGLLALSAFFLWPGIVEYTTTARITLHWSRLLAGAFTFLSAMQTAVFALLIEVVSLWMRQRTDLEREQSQEESLRGAVEKTRVPS
jgi:hypothetical protein